MQTIDENRSKFIFVTGGVISSVGKGITTSFIGSILKGHGYNVTAIKIDPYINIDAGTFSPYEHGEVFVLNDGSEVDLDLGNYERMLDIYLTTENNITTGNIYNLVIKNERAGKYLGKTVQVVPHITDAIQNWILQVANQKINSSDRPDSNICLVEVGGVVGDIESMPFLEAIRQLQSKIKNPNYCHIHVSYLPQIMDGDQKTKPTQMSVRQMRSLGLFPDFIFCRSAREIDIGFKTKISLFCDTPVFNIISLPDCANIYQLIPKLYEQKIVERMHSRLNLAAPVQLPIVHQWLDFTDRCNNVNKHLIIAIVGKYVSLKDAYHSITDALFQSTIFYDRKIRINWIQSDHLEKIYKNTNEAEHFIAWQKLRYADGVIIPGGFDKRGIEGKILATQYCRENKVPILGICLGLQVMVIEFAQNILKLEHANSTEIDPDTPYPVIIEMPEFNPLQKGGTMRLGLRKTLFTSPQCHATTLYGTSEFIFERHRHRFEFNVKYKKQFEEKGFRFVAQDETGTRMEIVELPVDVHPYFIGVQYHPEFLSRPLSPSPVFKGLVQSSISHSSSRQIKHNE